MDDKNIFDYSHLRDDEDMYKPTKDREKIA